MATLLIIDTVNRSVVMGITVQPQGAVGAEVAGVDLNHLDSATLASCVRPMLIQCAVFS